MQDLRCKRNRTRALGDDDEEDDCENEDEFPSRVTTMFSEAELVNAHSHSSHNLEEVQKSPNSGCFHCLKLFSSSEVTEWLADGTVICPYCDIDSVLGSLSGYPLTTEFLIEMNKRWFKRIVSTENLRKILHNHKR